MFQRMSQGFGRLPIGPSIPRFGIGSGHMYFPEFTQGGAANPGAVNSATMYFWPITLNEVIPCDGLVMHVFSVAAAAGTMARMGLYQNNPTYGFPDNLIVDARTVDLTTGLGLKVGSLSGFAVGPGQFWTCIHITETTSNANLTCGINAMYNPFIAGPEAIMDQGSNPRNVNLSAIPFGPLPVSLAQYFDSFSHQSSTVVPFLGVRRSA